MTSAAESVAFNIVEGCGAASRKEFARFLDISIKSTSELEYQLQLAKDYGVLPSHAWQSLTAETIEIRRMLCGLRRAVLDADRAETLKH
jgi:four helix bundle protein